MSFIANKRGYLLAMNRDEKLSRAKGVLPRRSVLDGRAVISPAEPGGGTWIALNDTGATFALINWYSVRHAVKANTVSRGEVVKSVAAQISASGVSRMLTTLPLKQINPFRLMAIFPAQKEIYQWCWNLRSLVCRKQHWKSQQWISSGYDEPTAQQVRSKTFRLAFRQKSAGRLAWLRRLHRSHAPVCGPFSTCMHRDDAASVSYTEIIFSKYQITMAQCNTAPCQSVTQKQLAAETISSLYAPE
ncbi:MAG: NRDE family protein [Verrucomicrobiota bacterium]